MLPAGNSRRIRRSAGPGDYPNRLPGIQAVLDAAAEIGGGGIGEILGQAAYLGDGIAKPQNLNQHLAIEYRFIRVDLQRQPYQQLMIRTCFGMAWI
jgi:hypothetical protein